MIDIKQSNMPVVSAQCEPPKAQIINAFSVKGNSFCGVYILTLKRKVVYVGQSVNMPERIARHKSERCKRFDSFTMFLCDKKDLNFIESKWIYHYKPKYNYRRKGGARSGPLKDEMVLCAPLSEYDIKRPR